MVRDHKQIGWICIKSLLRIEISTILQMFQQKNGSLGLWVYLQRRLQNRSRLLDERYSLLVSINFNWKDGARPRINWLHMYERLIEYEKEHHNANVPQNYDLDTKVGLWVMRQRNTYNNNKLLDEYTSLLNSIGFVWSMRRGNRTTTSTIPLSSRRKKFCAPEDADSITTAEITSTTIAVPTAVIRFHRLCLHLHLLLEVRSLMMSVAITMMTTTTYNTKMSLMSIIIRTNVFMLWQQQVMNIYLQFDISYRHHHHHHIKLNDFIYIGGDLQNGPNKFTFIDPIFLFNIFSKGTETCRSSFDKID